MKYMVIMSLAMICASLALAGVSRSGSLASCIAAPITVSALNADALNKLNNVGALSGNESSVPAAAPITTKKNNILSGILGGVSRG